MVGISAQTAALLVHYGFDLGGAKAERLAGQWLAQYPGPWLRLATVEALYQGRYKAVSVGHLLEMWQRLGQPLYHFNGEFERLVCSNLPQDLRGENEAKISLEEVSLPIENLDPTDLNLSPLPATESSPVREEAATLNIEVEESKEPPAIDRTGESKEVVVYQEDLAATELADKVEEAEKLAQQPAAKPVPIVKHPDFHSKLTALAKASQSKKRARRKKPGV